MGGSQTGKERLIWDFLTGKKKKKGLKSIFTPQELHQYWNHQERLETEQGCGASSVLRFILFSNQCTQKHTNMFRGLVGAGSAVWMLSSLDLEGVFSDQQKQALPQRNTHACTHRQI